MTFFKRYILIFCLVFLSNAGFCFDLENYGDFSSRSVIMNQLYKKNSIPQELKDVLTQKKLAPTTKCLFEQIKKGNTENVSLLLEAKIDPNSSYMSDYPIYYAARFDKFDILKLLYEKGAKLDRGFYSELYEAVRNKNKEMAQYLLDRNAKVNYSDSITNNTILYMALKNNMIDIASQLIDKGARADVKSVKMIKKKKLIDLVKDK